MNILITGCAGFIGSHLCRYYLAKGHNVIGADNLTTGVESNVPKGVKFINEDICYADNPIYTDYKYDLILNFASIASPIHYQDRPIDTMMVGSTAVFHLLQKASIDRCKILMASTSEVYGDPLEHPQNEEYWGNVNPIGVRSCYDESKRFMEALTMAYHKEYGVYTRIVRIFNTFGERMQVGDGRVIPNFINQALNGDDITVYGDGQQTRSLCYIDDLVNAINIVAESGDNKPYNIGNDYEVNMLELAQVIIELTESESKIVFKELPEDDPMMRKPDLTRVKELGYWPKVSLEHGLINTINYFK